MHPIQEAFWEKQGLQCGYCTPGMLLRAVEILRENPDPTREEVREGIARATSAAAPATSSSSTR